MFGDKRRNISGVAFHEPARQREDDSQDLQGQMVAFLTRMAELVRGTVDLSVVALLSRDPQVLDQILAKEKTINAMECLIDEHAVRTLIGRQKAEEDVRLIVSTLKINNDLERMGDLSISIARRIQSLSAMEREETPMALTAMAELVRKMVQGSLGAITMHNMLAANDVLHQEAVVDEQRDRIYELLLSRMEHHPSRVQATFQLLLIARYLERIADHAANIAEDVIYWVRGVDVRQGRLK